MPVGDVVVEVVDAEAVPVHSWRCEETPFTPPESSKPKPHVRSIVSKAPRTYDHAPSRNSSISSKWCWKKVTVKSHQPYHIQGRQYART